MTCPLPVVVTRATPSSGLCLGGVGSGGIELWPDGVFRHPGFLNTRPLCNGVTDAGAAPQPNFGVEDLFFLLRVKRPGEAPRLRWLFVGQGNAFLTWGHMSRTYKYAVAPTIRAIEYRAEFPAAVLRYVDERLPVEATLRAWSPFVPHDLDASTVPGVLLDFSVKSLDDVPVEVSVVAAATNLAGHAQIAAGQGHERRCEDGLVLAAMHGGREGEATTGQMALFAAPEAGQMSSLIACNPHIENIFVSVHDTGGLDGPLFPPRLAREEALAGPGEDGMHRNRAWVALGTTLEPGGETRFRIGLSWHFPHHRDRDGREVGKYYQNHFKDAVAVARHLVREGDELGRRSRVWPELMARSTLEPAFAAALLDQAATLVNGSWLTRAGDFFLWEGVGQAGMNTVDVDHYGSFGVALLFPELRRKVLGLIAAGQRPDGRVPHAFQQNTDPRTIPDGEYHRWDVNCQFVLALYREWRSSPDDALLEAHYAAACRALDLVSSRVVPELGLPWVEGGITYDHWHMVGVTAYLAGLWLAAIQALALMAEARGDAERARRCREAWRAGSLGFERGLWAGDQYRPVWRGEGQLTSVVVAAAPTTGGGGAADDLYERRYRVNSGGERLPMDKGLHTDALNGEASARLLGLRGATEPVRVRAHLASALAKNRHTDARFIANGSCPDGAFPDEWPFSQWQNPWTGTEYYFAAQLIAENFREEGLRVIRDVHDRLDSEGMRWNHVECGDHYSRALSVYASYQAWLGLRHDVRSGILHILPITGLDEPLRAPLLTPCLLGEMIWTPMTNGGEMVVNIVEGSAPLRGLVIPALVGSAFIQVDSEEATNLCVEPNYAGCFSVLTPKCSIGLHGGVMLCLVLVWA